MNAHLTLHIVAALPHWVCIIFQYFNGLSSVIP